MHLQIFGRIKFSFLASYSLLHSSCKFSVEIDHTICFSRCTIIFIVFALTWVKFCQTQHSYQANQEHYCRYCDQCGTKQNVTMNWNKRQQQQKLQPQLTKTAAFGAYPPCLSHTHSSHHCWIIADHWLRSVFRSLSLSWRFALNNARGGCFFFIVAAFVHCRHCRCHCCCVVVVFILPMFNGDQPMMKSYNGSHLYFTYLLRFKRAGTCGIRIRICWNALSHALTVTQTQNTNFRVAKQVPRDVAAIQAITTTITFFACIRFTEPS